MKPGDAVSGDLVKCVSLADVLYILATVDKPGYHGAVGTSQAESRIRALPTVYAAVPEDAARSALEGE